MFSCLMRLEFWAKMLTHEGFPIVLSQDICLLLSMWSVCRYECHPLRCGILCGHYPVHHQINDSCRIRLPRVQTNCPCPKTFPRSLCPRY